MFPVAQLIQVSDPDAVNLHVLYIQRIPGHHHKSVAAHSWWYSSVTSRFHQLADEPPNRIKHFKPKPL